MTAAAQPREKRAHIWERDPLDHYVEPPAATESLLAVERFVGAVRDPACGIGNIVETLRAAGCHATGSDIVSRRPDFPMWWCGVQDFLAEDYDEPLVNVVCNPPFGRAKTAEAFIRKALRLAAGKVAMFLDIRFLAGAERANGLFAEHPPQRVWILTPRVSCPPGSYLLAGNRPGGGTADHAWLVWDRTAPPATTTIGWLRRDAA